MYSNTSCTIFLSAEGYKKIYIPRCFLVPSSNSYYTKEGLVSYYTAKCLFECDKEINFTEGKDFLLEGEHDFNLEGASERAKSESLKALIDSKKYTVQRAMLKKYGSKNMWHYELSLN